MFTLCLLTFLYRDAFSISISALRNQPCIFLLILYISPSASFDQSHSSLATFIVSHSFSPPPSHLHSIHLHPAHPLLPPSSPPHQQLVRYPPSCIWLRLRLPHTPTNPRCTPYTTTPMHHTALPHAPRVRLGFSLPRRRRRHTKALV